MKIKVPKDAIAYILFQRTEYLRMARSKSRVVQFMYRALLKIISFNTYVRIEALLFPRSIAKKYSDDMNKEFESIKRYLPRSVKRILDIGCGVAGIDALIYQHYGSGAAVCLLDKTSTDEKVYYNFEKQGSFYNSLSVARELLRLNGIPAENIQTQEVEDDNQIKFNGGFDLVLSLISWGFHYPVSVYLDQVYDRMPDGGLLIIDVREDTEGEHLLRKKFKQVQIIFAEKKYKRILAQK